MNIKKCAICNNNFTINTSINIIGIHLTDKRTVCEKEECNDRYEEKKRIKVKSGNHKRVMNYFPRSNRGGVLPDFKGQSILNMDGGELDAVGMIRHFAQSDDMWFLGLLGTTGTGKTRFGLVLLAQLAYHGRFNGNSENTANTTHDIGYMKAKEINDIAKGTVIHPGSITPYRLKTMRVLMIDELNPRSQMTFKDSSALEDIIELRHDEGLKTILTSNMQPAEFEAEYPAIFSRCAQGLFELNGTDRRR